MKKIQAFYTNCARDDERSVCRQYKPLSFIHYYKHDPPRAVTVINQP